MHHAKNHGNKEITLAIWILPQSCITPPYIHVHVILAKAKGLRMIVVVSLIVHVYIAKGISLFP